MGNDKNSSKVSEGNEKSPEEVESSEIEKEDQAADEADESSDVASTETTSDDDDAVPDTAESDAGIEDAEVVLDRSADEEALAGGEDAAESEEILEETPPTPAPARQQPSGPSTGGLVFGGLIAGAIGFLVATFAVPEGWPNPPADPNEVMQAEIDAQAERIEALVAEVAALQDAPAAVAPAVDVDLGPLDAQVSGLVTRLDAVSDELAAASERISALETSPAPEVIVAPVPDVDFDAEMETFRAELEAAADAARAEVAAAQARAAEIEAQAQAAAEAAEAAAMVATQRAALAEVSAAIESGAPFVDALEVLPNAPDALTSVAGEGVPTLAALRAAFPNVARAALQGAQDVPADASATERMAAFLRKQTNARSLSPREGDDPDAVLSRAEAALNDGNLDAALAEISGLPDAATQSLSGWIAEAETRSAAIAAAQSLGNELN